MVDIISNMNTMINMKLNNQNLSTIKMLMIKIKMKNQFILKFHMNKNKTDGTVDITVTNIILSIMLISFNPHQKQKMTK